MKINCGFCIIPPVRCSDKIRAELRAAVTNKDGGDIEARAIFYINNENGLTGEVLYISPSVKIGPKESFVFSHWFSTSGYVGKRKITAEIYCGGERVLTEEKPLNIVPCSTRALPFIDTAWIEPGCYSSGKDGMKATAQDVKEHVELLRSVGIHSMIIAYTELIICKQGAFFPSLLEETNRYPAPVDFDLVGAIMEQADALSMNVFVGLGRGDDLMLTWNGFEDKDRIKKQVDFSNALAKELWERYGAYKSFYGWYMAHEADDLAKANSYYNPVSRYLHSLAPEKPVLIAPSGTPIVDANILKSCDYDIIAYQDAVGSGYIPYENTYNQENRIKMLHDCYSRYAKAHVGADKHFWTDLEIWKMDGPDYSNAYASPYHQVARQIEIERIYADSISCYAFPGMFEDENARFKYACGKGSVELCRQYRQYYEKARGAYGL